MTTLNTEEQPGLKGMEHRGGNFVTVGEVVKLFGVSERRVQQWAKEIPMIEKNKRGHYNLLSVIRGVYLFQRAIIDGRGDNALSAKRAEKLELEMRILNMQIDEKQAGFVDSIELEKELGKVFVEFKNIRLIPRSYSQQLINIILKYIDKIAKRKKLKKFNMLLKEKKALSAEIETLLMLQIDKALKNLSKGFTSERLTNGTSSRNNK